MHFHFIERGVNSHLSPDTDVGIYEPPLIFGRAIQL